MATSKSVTLCFVLLVGLCAAVSLSTSSPMGNSNAELYGGGGGGPFGEEGAELGAELNANSSPYEKLGSEFVGATSGNDDDDNGNSNNYDNNDNNAATEAEGTVEADIESEADSSSQFSPRTRSSSADSSDDDSESADSDSLDGQDSNIENARIELTPRDKATASGHHYHGHGVHGMLKMGASTGKKGAFKWHDKHPVGGKGRR